jgi:hypothetical protein
MLLTWTPPGVDPAVGTVRLLEPMDLSWEDYQSRVQARVIYLARTAPEEDLELLSAAESEGLELAGLEPAQAGVVLAEESEALMMAILGAMESFPVSKETVAETAKPESTDDPMTLADLLLAIYPDLR